MPNSADRAWSFSYEARKNLSLGDDRDSLLTWLHELGHQVKYRGGNVTIPKDIVRLTQYSTTNDSEWFAEHFVAWIIDREALMLTDPAAVRIIEDAIENAMKKTPAHLRFKPTFG